MQILPTSGDVAAGNATSGGVAGNAVSGVSDAVGVAAGSRLLYRSR